MISKCVKTITALIFIIQPVCAQSFQDFVSRVYGSPDSLRIALVDSFMNAVPSFPLVEDDTLCHFLYRGNASSVTVPGDANGWNGSAFPMSKLSTTNLWYYTRSFEADARLDYKFVLNGFSWILDPRNPLLVSGGFGPNSELRMPLHIPASEIEFNPAIPHGTLRDTTFFSPTLGNSRTIRVYTPPSYQLSTDSFGVVLVHDGLEYVTLAQMNNVLDNLIAQNRIQPVIAVFVPPVNRTPEYAGNQMNQFTAFIVSELMPYIDARYRTRRDPQHRAVLGASNGGNISLWIGYQHPEMFGNIAAQSSNIISSISSGFQNSPTLPLKLSLDLGTYDIGVLIPLVRNFIPILQSKGYPYRYEEFHEGHSWGNWRAHVDNALEFFFPGSALSANEENREPESFKLFQNYPNPFNPKTIINYQQTTSNWVTLKVFDVLGKEVALLVNEDTETGSHSVEWDAAGLPSGVYFARLSSSRSVQAIKLMLLK